MAINNITQTISTIPEAAHRGIDVQTLFVTKQEDFQDHLQGTTVTELNTLKDQLNSRIGEINSTTTTMNGYADTASAGASTATTKAGEASTSASGALTSRNQAETFKNNASASATKASQWADNNYNVEVETGKYSAKHWSTVAQNTAASVSNFGFKNYIINGNFDVWQYGVSQTTSGYGSDDRWFNVNTGSTKTHSQIACTDTERALFNASYFSRTVVSSVAEAYHSVQKFQRIENVTKLAGKTITLSFWAKADSNKNIAIDFGQAFGSGGAPSAVVVGIGAQKIALTTTWQKKSITVTLPNIIGKTIGTDGVHTSSTYIDFWFDAGSNSNSRTANLGQQSGTFDIAQVQLEEGSVATPFEQRPIGLELSLCQRYYEVQYVNQVGGYYVGNQALDSINWYVLKRVAPTIAFSGINYSACNSLIVNSVSIYSFTPQTTSTNLLSGLNYTVSASAEL